MNLIQRARAENDWLLVSIFVNPLQFGPQEDLGAYPRTLEADLERCQIIGVDAVFCPTPEVLYGAGQPHADSFTQVLPPAAMLQTLCGPHRLGHFTGVTTVVTKLFNLVQPDRAYFGRKDAQQLAVIRRMVTDLDWAIMIVGCATVREPDGLAMSSRNQYLSTVERSQAATLYQGLQSAKLAFAQGERNGQKLINIVRQVIDAASIFDVQYVDLVHPETMQPLESVETVGLLAIAAHLGKTRLIDNILLRSRLPIVAIDGPAGAGKSTVARLLADRLGLLYLDTGAMYRASTWLILQLGIDPKDEVAVAEALSDARLQLTSDPCVDGKIALTRVWINDQEVTEVIRTPEVTGQVSTIAAQPMVREILVRQQQAYGAKGGVVIEGRDIGTHVFPFAELKIFLTASIAERARRRQKDLVALNQPPKSLAEIEKDIEERDRKDSTRRIAPLQKAQDAVEILTDGLSITAVVDKIMELYAERLGQN
jgi:pantoate ligase/cytidylate kinase